MTSVIEHLSLVDQLRSWSDDILAEELHRLARRAPQLTEDELLVIHHALAQLVEGTLLSPARTLPWRTRQLRDLFGLAS